MKELVIQILASDINSSSFHDSQDCAIKRAIDRTKERVRFSVTYALDINTNKIANLKDLNERVMNMYNYLGKLSHLHPGCEKPKDFIYTIKFN